MITKHLKFPLNTTSHGFGKYCRKKIMYKAVVDVSRFKSN